MSYAMPITARTSDTVTVSINVKDFLRTGRIDFGNSKNNKESAVRDTAAGFAYDPPVKAIDLDEERKAKKKAKRKTKSADTQRWHMFRKSAIPLLPLIPFGAVRVLAHEPGVTSESIPASVPGSETIPVTADATMQAKMMAAFAPIIELVQSLAYPVALLVVLGGGLFVMIGNSEKGFSLIQRAALGYVLVMMMPMLLDVLVDAMRSVI